MRRDGGRDGETIRSCRRVRRGGRHLARRVRESRGRRTDPCRSNGQVRCASHQQVGRELATCSRREPHRRHAHRPSGHATDDRPGRRRIDREHHVDGRLDGARRCGRLQRLEGRRVDADEVPGRRAGAISDSGERGRAGLHQDVDVRFVVHARVVGEGPGGRDAAAASRRAGRHRQRVCSTWSATKRASSPAKPSMPTVASAPQPAAEAGHATRVGIPLASETAGSWLS